MRADRLLSLLMILQTRGRVTAEVLARELEVSVRTIYRDLDALSTAGMPVYGERGPGGGCALLDSYRTTLTGLTDDEVRALHIGVVTIPAALAQLGLGAELKAALLKLSAALPAERRADELWIRQRVHLDWSGGPQASEPVPHLPAIQQAVWQDRRLSIVYHLDLGPGAVELERQIDAYGLVAHLGAWHLVGAADGRVRVYRVSGLLDATVTGEHFERPAGLDLAAFWAAWCAEGEARRNRSRYSATVRVSPDALPWLPWFADSAGLREQIDAARACPDRDGWLTLTLSFDSLEAARGRLLAMGAGVEVLAPMPLRLSVADYGAQIAALYGKEQEAGNQP